MNSGVTSDRVYDALKRRILDVTFRPGARLDPAHLGDELSSSVTPVREGLNRLRGEGLVETRTGEGFFLPQVDAPALQDLYDWNLEVLTAAMRRIRSEVSLPEFSTPSSEGSGPIAEATADVFTMVARRSRNAEHERAVASNNDRLHAVRLAEQNVIDGVAAEIALIRSSLSAELSADVRKLLAAYHRRRRHHAADIVRALYRYSGDDR